MTDSKEKYRPHFPVARIRRIIQSNEEVAWIQPVVPILFSCILELFVVEAAKGANELALSKGKGKTVNNAIMLEYFGSCPHFSILAKNFESLQKGIIPSTASFSSIGPDGSSAAGGLSYSSAETGAAMIGSSTTVKDSTPNYQERQYKLLPRKEELDEIYEIQNYV